MTYSISCSLLSLLLFVSCSGNPKQPTENNTEENLNSLSNNQNQQIEKLPSLEKQQPSSDTTNTELNESELNHTRKDTLATLPKTAPNKTEKNTKGNVIEFYQSFKKENKQAEYVSDELPLDLSNTASGMLSAYSIDKSTYTIFYRVFINNKWSTWEALQENTEVNNSNRKAFSPKQLSSATSKIQFKSDQKTDQEVIFRIFTFSKN